MLLYPEIDNSLHYKSAYKNIFIYGILHERWPAKKTFKPEP